MSFYCGVSLRWLSFSSCPTIMVAVRCGKRFATKRTDCHQGERVLLFQLEVRDEEKEARACLQLRPRWLSPGEAAAAPPGWSAHSLLRTAASWPLRYCVLDTATAAKRQPQKSPEKPLGSLFQASQSVDSCLETSLWLIAKLPSRLSCCQPLVWPPPSPSFHRPGSIAPKQACSRLLSLWLLVFKCLALTEICSLASSIFLGIVIFSFRKKKSLLVFLHVWHCKNNTLWIHVAPNRVSWFGQLEVCLGITIWIINWSSAHCCLWRLTTVKPRYFDLVLKDLLGDTSYT